MDRLRQLAVVGVSGAVFVLSLVVATMTVSVAQASEPPMPTPFVLGTSTDPFANELMNYYQPESIPACNANVNFDFVVDERDADFMSSLIDELAQNPEALDDAIADDPDALDLALDFFDANDDGVFTSADVVFIQHHLGVLCITVDHATCKADFDRNGEVELGEYNIVLANQGSMTMAADVNYDDRVDQEDVAVVQEALATNGCADFGTLSGFYTVACPYDVNGDTVLNGNDVEAAIAQIGDDLVWGDLDGNRRINNIDLAIAEVSLGSDCTYNLVASCELDVDGSGIVNNDDYNLVQQYMGMSIEDCPVAADVNHNCRIDYDDAALVAARQGEYCFTDAEDACASDVNRDGMVNLDDVGMIESRLDTTTTVGDVDHDGRVTLLDIDLAEDQVGAMCTTNLLDDRQELEDYDLSDVVLYKVDGLAAVYAIEDGYRLTFPNEKIYRSWFGDQFSSIITIDREQLYEYPSGGNVLYAPGSLLKIPSDNRVYKVGDFGELHWFRSEADFLGQGYSFGQIHDLPEVFFSDYVVVDAITP